ncbi:MAG: metallophosphoesterase [Phycisphaerae bacterium]|nr:metallophosphoesterase [Phycisphaerae bacterium]
MDERELPCRALYLAARLALIALATLAIAPAAALSETATPVNPPAAHDLRFLPVPVLGAVGGDFFTVTCRTNVAVAVTLTATNAKAPGAKRELADQPALVHRFRMDRLDPAGQWSYVLSARTPSVVVATDPTPVRLISPGTALRFVTLGDSKKNVKDWAAVTARVAATRPDLVVHLGDMTEHGEEQKMWDKQFFGPAAARELLASTPVYAVKGNHEDNSPLFDDFFCNPTAEGCPAAWSQELNGVLLVGLDGAADWSPQGKSYPWLERTLDGSRARFVFIFTHYPGLTSSRHGKLDSEGEPSEHNVRQTYDHIYPLARKFNVTALVAGHEHCYERSELPGLTQVTTGAAGASRRQRSPDWEKQNPYSKVFASSLNFGLFEVNGDTCTMTAFNQNGRALDHKQWKARALP